MDADRCYCDRSRRPPKPTGRGGLQGGLQDGLELGGEGLGILFSLCEEKTRLIQIRFAVRTADFGWIDILMAGSTRLNLLWNMPFGATCWLPGLQDCWWMDVVCRRLDMDVILALQDAALGLKNQLKLTNRKWIQWCFFNFGNSFA